MAIGSRLSAKTAAMVKGMSAVLRGYPGIFHQLASEHEEVSVLMKRVATGDSATRGELFPEIYRNLMAHAHAEEQTFYPRLRRHLELEQTVAQCLAEHERIEELLDELHLMDSSTQQWTELFLQLQRVVEAHVMREERELFPQAREQLNREQADEMKLDYTSVEAHEKSRLH